jgi:hypothetical protein
MRKKFPKMNIVSIKCFLFAKNLAPSKSRRPIFYWKFLELLQRSCQFYENKIKI